MALQRERKIVFSGCSGADAEIRVVFTDNIRTGRSCTDGFGRVTFPSRRVGGPFSLSIGYENEPDSIF